MSGGGPFASAYGDSKGRIATVGSSRSPVDEHGHCGVTSKSCTRDPWVYCAAQPSPYAFATCPGVVSPLSTSNHLRLEFRRVRSPCHDDLLPVCPTPSWAAPLLEVNVTRLRCSTSGGHIPARPERLRTSRPNTVSPMLSDPRRCRVSYNKRAPYYSVSCPLGGDVLGLL